MHNILWEKFVSEENFILALERLEHSTHHIIDNLGRDIFKNNLNENIINLITMLTIEPEMDYKPTFDRKIYIPKPSGTMRTISMMRFSDSIVYQAMVNVIADKSHQFLVTHENEHVWGNLYAGEGNKWMLKSWLTQYLSFSNEIKRLFSSGMTWIATTDIASFYDTIDHSILIELIRRYCGEDDKFIKFFQLCLKRWSSHKKETFMSRGIPQGSNASDYLANLYLYEIDKHLIRKGIYYIRYVDDIRIMGKEKRQVQKGLIEFDLELKKYGLIAQINKTSIYNITDINREMSRLDLSLPSDSKDEVSLMLHSEQNSHEYKNIPIDELSSNQEYLYALFKQSLENLDDPNKSKNAETTIIFCLFRMEKNDAIKQSVISLLERLPWRSSILNGYLSLFENDEYLETELKKLLQDHDVYDWHRSNMLYTLDKIHISDDIIIICRNWLLSDDIHWYAKITATKILKKFPKQHSFLLECLLNEQIKIVEAPEDTVFLRQELALASFETTRNKRKQKRIFDIILDDKEHEILHYLAIYLFQHKSSKISWDSLNNNQQKILGKFSQLIKDIGITQNIERTCYILFNLKKSFDLDIDIHDLRNFYNSDYDNAAKDLKKVINYLHSNDNESLINELHSFAHITLKSFSNHILQSNAIEYSDLYNQKSIRQHLVKSIHIWEDLGKLRNRASHPFETKTQKISQEISSFEVNRMRNEIKIAFQELFDAWMSHNTPRSSP